jgi:phosphonopyruvate decarboxylase
MISAAAFLDALAGTGFGLVTGVPCSYFGGLFERVTASPGMRYAPAVNEGDAVAIAAGARLGGTPAVVMMQNSGLGNAVSPLTSLCAIFKIPVLLVVTWRGQPGGAADEPQHALMGRITTACLDVLQIPWAMLPAREEELSAALAQASQSMRTTGLPYALLVVKDTFHADPLPPADCPRSDTAPASAATPYRSTDAAAALEQDDVLAAIRRGARVSDALIATTGFTGRALYALGDTPNQLYIVGSMGCASSVALGLAVTCPRARFIVLDGDGALLMRMGALAAVGAQRPRNLVHVVLDNGVHDSTGGQATVSAAVDLPAVARACGYARVVQAASAAQVESLMAEECRELTFIHVRTKPRGNRTLPRPRITPPEVAARFSHWLERPC